MGQIYYDRDAPVEIQDRALVHLKVVITTKLRRGESFMVTWANDPDGGGGRTSIWVSPAIALRFVTDSPDPIPLNPQWLEELMDTASMTGVIRLVPEADHGPLMIPPAEGSAPRQRR